MWSYVVTDFINPKCTGHRLHACTMEKQGAEPLDFPLDIVDCMDVLGEKEVDQLPPTARMIVQLS